MIFKKFNEFFFIYKKNDLIWEENSNLTYESWNNQTKMFQ